MTRPAMIQTGPLMPEVEAAIATAFDVHRLWEADDKDAMIARVADSICGIATAGHGPVNGALMERLPNLKIVSNFGVGYDSVDAAWAGQHGVIVTNTPDVLTEEVADTTLGMMLMTIRELGAAERYIRDGKWTGGNYPLTVTTLRNRSVGILGLGRIGKAIAHRLAAFGVPVSYYGRNKQTDVLLPYFSSLTEMAGSVDTLVCVLPGGAKTDKLINAEVLKALGSDGVVFNIGRGSVIDEAALIAALKDGTIHSAGLDVFETEPCVPSELIAMGRVVLLPHVGSASVHTRAAMGKLVADNLLAYAAGTPPLTPVAETPFNGW